MSATGERERVVIRFTPLGVDGLRNTVKKQALGDLAKNRPPRYGVSVFGDFLRDDEDIDAAVERLCGEITHHFAGGDRLSVTTERVLNEHGYALHAVMPPEFHYLIGGAELGEEPELDALAEQFTKNRRKNPAFKEG